MTAWRLARSVLAERLSIFFKVTDILQDDVLRLMLLKDIEGFLEKRPAGLVTHPVL